LSLSLLVDEDSQAKYLVQLLRAANHNVLTVNEAGIAGFPDDKVLDYARQHSRILLTRNCNDFRELHQANSTHPGIIAIYQDAEPANNLGYQAIVKAISNLEDAGLELGNQFVVLNQWSY
jgi:predicted nuclease of predicted toxin-antitoxin system